jgi:hypothetical protein
MRSLLTFNSTSGAISTSLTDSRKRKEKKEKEKPALVNSKSNFNWRHLFLSGDQQSEAPPQLHTLICLA